MPRLKCNECGRFADGADCECGGFAFPLPQDLTRVPIDEFDCPCGCTDP